MSRRCQCVFEIDDLDPQDVQRTFVRMVDKKNRHVPSGHRSVEQPTPGEFDYIDHFRGDHVKPIPHGELGGAMSRANDSAYSLKTSVSGIEGLSNHVVSIPVRKAIICTALTVTSISMRYRPAR